MHHRLCYKIRLQHQGFRQVQPGSHLTPDVTCHDHIHSDPPAEQVLPQTSQVLREGRLGAAINEITPPSPYTGKRRQADDPFQAGVLLIHSNNVKDGYSACVMYLHHPETGGKIE